MIIPAAAGHDGPTGEKSDRKDSDARLTPIGGDISVCNVDRSVRLRSYVNHVSKARVMTRMFCHTSATQGNGVCR